MTGNTTALLRAAAAWAEVNYPGRRLKYIRLRIEGVEKSVRLPYDPEQIPVAADPAAGLSDCEGDILTVLEQAGKRMRGDALKKALQDAGHLHGDSTITKALAALGREKKLLTNRRDSHGHGYGLADWS